jgi:hypothetical protein
MPPLFFANLFFLIYILRVYWYSYVEICLINALFLRIFYQYYIVTRLNILCFIVLVCKLFPSRCTELNGGKKRTFATVKEFIFFYKRPL